MIDYIRIDYHFTDKDTPNLQDFQGVSPDKYGWKRIELQGFAPIAIGLNERSGILRVKGSIMYFFQGHNFTFSRDGFIEVVEVVGDRFNINLWDGCVEELEVAVIVEVDRPPLSYIKNHWEPNGWWGSTYKTTRYFVKGKALKKENAELYLRMYDVGKNLRYKCRGMDLQEIGLISGKYYLKFEIHYNKPHKSLKRGGILRLRDVFTRQMQEGLKGDIRAYYGQLRRNYVVIPPNDRKTFDTSMIFAVYGLGKAVNSGQSILEAKKDICDMINQNPAFTKEDKANRRRGVKKVMDKVGDNAIDGWDLSGIINRQLEQEEIITL